jgi:hypothetical protein
MKVYSNAEKIFLKKSRREREIRHGGPQQCSGKARECGYWGTGIGFELARARQMPT